MQATDVPEEKLARKSLWFFIILCNDPKTSAQKLFVDLFFALIK